MAWSDTLNLGSADPRVIAGNLINSGLGYLGIIVVVIVLWAGFKWMTSGGKEEKVTDAKKTLVSLVIGLAIMLTALSAVNFIIKAITNATGATQ
ncbi:MAG: hypothetical protein KAZ30_03775 [Candidatus Magasanikbacteria bacterium]|nr:hypothetical protein [Candidatus Magasanikbacteria bacterium]